MIDPVFRISQLTLPVATVLGAAWVLVNGNNMGAFLLFVGGVLFTFGLRILEQEIFVENVDNNRYR